MPIEAIIILVVTLLALLAGVIYLFVRSDFPKFKFYKEGVYNNVKARIWAENEDILALIDEKTVAKAAWSVQAAWNSLGIHGGIIARNTMTEVALIATTDKTFPKWGYYESTAVGAVQIWIKNRIFDKNIPASVLHETKLRSRGDAESAYSIHEYIHACAHKALGNEDRLHQNEELWGALTAKATDFYTRY